MSEKQTAVQQARQAAIVAGVNAAGDLTASPDRHQALLAAVLHQMQHGEAADFLRGPDVCLDLDAARRDLRWCRDQLAAALRMGGA